MSGLRRRKVRDEVHSHLLERPARRRQWVKKSDRGSRWLAVLLADDALLAEFCYVPVHVLPVKPTAYGGEQLLLP